MKERLRPPPFENTMTSTQTALGWVYLALHILGIPLLLGLYSTYAVPLDDAAANAVYYGLGLAFTLIVMLRFLRAGFDRLLDNIRLCALTLLLALGLDYLLSGIFTAILLLFEQALSSPNNEAVMNLAETNTGLVKGLAVYIAPLVEETLFRGVAFGSLRKKEPRAGLCRQHCAVLALSCLAVRARRRRCVDAAVCDPVYSDLLCARVEL